MHLLVYAKDAKQGWLSKKGIDELRSTFGNDIFRQEQYKLFTMETELRNRLKDEARERLQKLLEELNDSYAPDSETLEMFQALINQLGSYHGRKQYAYLPPEIKETVNAIVRALAQDERIAELYDEWTAINREKLSLYHEKELPVIPLEDNKEFRSIKNEIIKYAAQLAQTPEAKQSTVYARSFLRMLAVSLGKMLTNSYVKRQKKLQAQVDKRLRSKIEQKKATHGIKSDLSVQDEDQGFGMTM